MRSEAEAGLDTALSGVPCKPRQECAVMIGHSTWMGVLDQGSHHLTPSGDRPGLPRIEVAVPGLRNLLLCPDVVT